MALITWNPEDKGQNVNLSIDKLTAEITHNTGGSQTRVRATQGKIGGKWYWEIKFNESSASPLIGMAQLDIPTSSSSYTDSRQRMYFANSGYKYSYDTKAYGESFGNIGDVIGIIVNLEEGTLQYTKNGIEQGVAFSDMKDLELPIFPYLYSGTNGKTNVTVNFGSKKFDIVNSNPTLWRKMIKNDYKPYDLENANWDWFHYFLLKQNNQYYTINPEHYQNGQFQPLTLEGGEQPNENDYENFGFKDINDLLMPIQVGEETFKPYDKLENEFEICMAMDKE